MIIVFARFIFMQNSMLIASNTFMRSYSSTGMSVIITWRFRYLLKTLELLIKIYKL